MIHGILLCKNEENRWLDKWIKQINFLCDNVVCLDDGSIDKTPLILQNEGYTVIKKNNSSWGTNEVNLRSELFNEVLKNANENDFILCLDSDELFEESHLHFIKYLFKTLSIQVDSIGFRLFDFWNKTHYREDALWNAHLHYFPMAIRYKKDINYIWSNKTLHCGRFPINSAKKMIPTEIPIKHMGWSTELDRLKKYTRYMQIDNEGKNGILEQYKSILDINPNLKKFGGTNE
jgi:glycosyltransferase involved in cell wall biosynthesis